MWWRPSWRGREEVTHMNLKTKLPSDKLNTSCAEQAGSPAVGQAGTQQTSCGYIACRYSCYLGVISVAIQENLRHLRVN